MTSARLRLGDSARDCFVDCRSDCCREQSLEMSPAPVNSGVLMEPYHQLELFSSAGGRHDYNGRRQTAPFTRIELQNDGRVCESNVGTFPPGTSAPLSKKINADICPSYPTPIKCRIGRKKAAVAPKTSSICSSVLIQYRT